MSRSTTRILVAATFSMPLSAGAQALNMNCSSDNDCRVRFNDLTPTCAPPAGSGCGYQGPNICLLDNDPANCTGGEVCGCDNYTYENVCQLHEAGVPLQSLGPCPEPCTLQCDPDQHPIDFVEGCPTSCVCNAAPGTRHIAGFTFSLCDTDGNGCADTTSAQGCPPPGPLSNVQLCPWPFVSCPPLNGCFTFCPGP